MSLFENVVKGDINASNSMKKFLKQEMAVMKMQIKNLTMSIDIINN